MSIPELAEALNVAAADFEVGHLQELRVRLRGLSRAPCKGIFNAQTTFDDYAFHLGGRTELQFNIGVEEVNGAQVIRHGLAFSLEPSQTLPSIDPLLPKVARFNDYVRTHPEDFPGMRMWHFDKAGRRSEDRPVSPIEDDQVSVGNFIALGRWAPPGKLTVEEMLTDFDRLLPLYRFVESEGPLPESSAEAPFVPGCPEFVESATLSSPARTIDVALRHKALQPVLYRILSRESGEDNVRIEYPLELGVRVDAAVREKKEFVFYELKVGADVQSCMRAALGQLLEYSYWPSADRARELIVVGEHLVDAQAAAYLQLLRKRFDLPIWYRRLDAATQTLGPKE